MRATLRKYLLMSSSPSPSPACIVSRLVTCPFITTGIVTHLCCGKPQIMACPHYGPAMVPAHNRARRPPTLLHAYFVTLPMGSPTHTISRLLVAGLYRGPPVSWPAYIFP